MYDHARIGGSGAYVAQTIQDNEGLENELDLKPGYIERKTKFQHRHIANPSLEIPGGYGLTETLEGMGAHAARIALYNARITPGDLDYIIVTSTADAEIPNIAAKVSLELGRRVELFPDAKTHMEDYDGELLTEGVPFIAIDNACSGFVYALNLAAAKVRQGYKNVAVIATEVATDRLGEKERTRMIFEDGASAVIVQAAAEPGYLGEVEYGYPSMAQFITYDEEGLTDKVELRGNGWHRRIWRTLCMIKDYMLRRPEAPTSFKRIIRLNQGPKIKYWGIDEIVKLTHAAMDRIGNPDEQVTVIPHLANGTMLSGIRGAQRRLGDQFTVIDYSKDFANSISASAGVQAHRLCQEGGLKNEKVVIFEGFGAGLASAASAWRVGGLEDRFH